MNNIAIPLTNRTILCLRGAELNDFLQGIITQDINTLRGDQAIYSCILNAQGKFLFDFFIIYKAAYHYLIDCDLSQKDALLKTLKRYKLRKPIEITHETALHVHAVIPKETHIALAGKHHTDLPFLLEDDIAYTDPRDSRLGYRIISYFPLNIIDGYEAQNFEAYENVRLMLGIIDGEADLTAESSYPLQWQLDHIHAFSFTKGCYVGQEVTIRTKHKGTLRKSLFKVSCKDGILAHKGDIITLNEKKIGIMGSSLGQYGLALIDHDKLNDAGDTPIKLVEQSIQLIALYPAASSDDN